MMAAAKVAQKQTNHDHNPSCGCTRVRQDRRHEAITSDNYIDFNPTSVFAVTYYKIGVTQLKSKNTKW